MAKKIILSFLIVLLSYFVYTVVLLLDIDSPIQYKNNEKCKRIELEMATEDLALFKNFIIGVTSDSIKTFFLHYSAGNAKPGYLISIEKTSKEVKRIKTLNFPSEYQINGHGIKIFNERVLHVISHSYNKGGERVFVFDLELINGEVQALYKRSYYFEGDHSKYNSIALVDESHFYLTQWIPFPDEPEGRDFSFLTDLNRALTTLYRKVNPIKFCSVIRDDEVKCEEMAYGYMPNGIFYENKKLFVSDTYDKTIQIFQVLPDFKLKSEGKVNVGHPVDNLWGKDGDVYVAGVARVWDLIAFGDAVQKGLKTEKVPGGAGRVYFNGEDWKYEEVVMQDLSDLVTAVVLTDEIVLSSVIDPCLVFCPLPKAS